MKHHIAQRAYIFSTSVGLAVLFAFLVIIPNHFPYLGLSLWFVMALTAVYVFKDHADHDRYATSLYVFSLIVAALIVASSLLIATKVEPIVLGYSALGLFGLVIAVVFGLVLVARIFVSREF